MGLIPLPSKVKDQSLTSACSCYIGKHGYCHHCVALALTFLKNGNVFEEVKTRTRDELQKLETLNEYLDSVTLDSLLQELKASGITQKAFAESMGMNPRHLSWTLNMTNFAQCPERGNAIKSYQTFRISA